MTYTTEQITQTLASLREIGETVAYQLGDDNTENRAALIIADLQSKLDAVREVIYEQFTKGKCSELVAVGLIEKIIREPQK